MRIGASLDAITGRVIAQGRASDSLGQLMAGIASIIEECQLDVIEVPLDAAFVYPSLFTEEILARMCALADEKGFIYTVHLPFMWLDLSSLNENIRKASVASVIEAVKLAIPLNPLVYVLHLTGEQASAIANSKWEEGEKRFFISRMVKQARRSLDEILRHIDRDKLCLENPETPALEPMMLLAGERKLPLCLDVGHLVSCGGDPITFIEEHFDDIKIIHLHDVAKYATAQGVVIEDHRPLGSGIVPLNEILHLLYSRSYEGILLLEMVQREHLLRSVEVLHSAVARLRESAPDEHS